MLSFILSGAARQKSGKVFIRTRNNYNQFWMRVTTKQLSSDSERIHAELLPVGDLLKALGGEGKEDDAALQLLKEIAKHASKETGRRRRLTNLSVTLLDLLGTLMPSHPLPSCAASRAPLSGSKGETMTKSNKTIFDSWL